MVIDPGYLTAEADVRRQVAGLRRAKELFATAALAPFTGPPMAPYWGPETDEELVRWIRERSETLYHPVGTCRMGADEESVVDPSLRVRGISALRVADASVMPVINRGHTHAHGHDRREGRRAGRGGPGGGRANHRRRGGRVTTGRRPGEGMWHGSHLT
ncbi:GMC oxidoreductase [Planomonospora parontospora]|uniref:GMC oxidoreductase n=1 Tax=Planomonospora parontospora TaxID=58119 RepID=UPI0036234BB0